MQPIEVVGKYLLQIVALNVAFSPCQHTLRDPHTLLPVQQAIRSDDFLNSALDGNSHTVYSNGFYVFFYIEELLHVTVFSEKHHELLIFYAILGQGIALTEENLISYCMQDLVGRTRFCVRL